MFEFCEQWVKLYFSCFRALNEVIVCLVGSLCCLNLVRGGLNLVVLVSLALIGFFFVCFVEPWKILMF